MPGPAVVFDASGPADPLGVVTVPTPFDFTNTDGIHDRLIENPNVRVGGSFFDVFFAIAPATGRTAQAFHLHGATDQVGAGFAAVALTPDPNGLAAFGLDVTVRLGASLDDSAPLFSMTLTAQTVPEPSGLTLAFGDILRLGRVVFARRASGRAR